MKAAVDTIQLFSTIITIFSVLCVSVVYRYIRARSCGGEKVDTEYPPLCLSTLYFETSSHCIWNSLTGYTGYTGWPGNLRILLPLLPQHWDDRQTPQHSAFHVCAGDMSSTVMFT